MTIAYTCTTLILYCIVKQQCWSNHIKTGYTKVYTIEWSTPVYPQNGIGVTISIVWDMFGNKTPDPLTCIFSVYFFQLNQPRLCIGLLDNTIQKYLNWETASSENVFRDGLSVQFWAIIHRSWGKILHFDTSCPQYIYTHTCKHIAWPISDLIFG